MAEHQCGFRQLVKWCARSKGRISYLRRSCGCDRTRLDGIKGVQMPTPATRQATGGDRHFQVLGRAGHPLVVGTQTLPPEAGQEHRAYFLRGPCGGRL